MADIKALGNTPDNRKLRLESGLFQKRPFINRLLGLCSRESIGFVLGSRFGYAIHGRQTIREHPTENPFSVRLGTPLREVLEWVLSRTAPLISKTETVATETASNSLSLFRNRLKLTLKTNMTCAGNWQKLVSSGIPYPPSLSGLVEGQLPARFLHQDPGVIAC